MKNLIPFFILVLFLFSSSLKAETNNQFTFIPKNGRISIRYNNVELKTEKEIESIFRSQTDKTSYKLFIRSQVKAVFATSFSILGGAAIGFGYAQATSSKDPILNDTGSQIVFWSGIGSLVIGILFGSSASTDYVKAFEYFNSKAQVKVSMNGIRFDLPFN